MKEEAKTSWYDKKKTAERLYELRSEYEEKIGQYNDSAIASTIVDLTVCFLLAEIIYSTCRIDRLKKTADTSGPEKTAALKTIDVSKEHL